MKRIGETMAINLTNPTNQLTPENLCMFVANFYGKYQGAYLCGKCAEILVFLLKMGGFAAEKVAVDINGTGHIFVKSGALYLDPTIKQFGDYPEISTCYPLPFELLETAK